MIGDMMCSFEECKNCQYKTKNLTIDQLKNVFDRFTKYSEIIMDIMNEIYECIEKDVPIRSCEIFDKIKNKYKNHDPEELMILVLITNFIHNIVLDMITEDLADMFSDVFETTFYPITS